MEEINLLQNRIKDTTYSSQKQGSKIVVALWVIVFLLVAGAATLYLLTRTAQSTLASIQSDNQRLQQEITLKRSGLGDAITFQAQLANLKTLLDGHVYISPLLDEISQMTYSRAQYVTLDIEQSGKIHMEGLVPQYSDLGKFILGLSTSEQFKNIKLNSIVPSTGETSAYQFSVDMEVNPDIFIKP